LRYSELVAEGVDVSEIVNLNKARKAKARSTAKSEAAENRVRFGRTKAEKGVQKGEVSKLERRLDQAKRED
jgi:hypothetical protein